MQDLEHQTAGLAFGGDTDPGRKAETEQWNGTNWTEVNDLNTARYLLGGAGVANTSLCFGGYDGSNILKKQKKRSSWAETSNGSSCAGLVI